MSYVSSVGGSIPSEFLSPDIAANFYSENYARIIMYTDTGEEGEDAFSTVETVRSLAAKILRPELYLRPERKPL